MNGTVPATNSSSPRYRRALCRRHWSASPAVCSVVLITRNSPRSTVPPEPDFHPQTTRCAHARGPRRSGSTRAPPTLTTRARRRSVGNGLDHAVARARIDSRPAPMSPRTRARRAPAAEVRVPMRRPTCRSRSSWPSDRLRRAAQGERLPAERDLARAAREPYDRSPGAPVARRPWPGRARGGTGHVRAGRKVDHDLTRVAGFSEQLGRQGLKPGAKILEVDGGARRLADLGDARDRPAGAGRPHPAPAARRRRPDRARGLVDSCRAVPGAGGPGPRWLALRAHAGCVRDRSPYGGRAARAGARAGARGARARRAGALPAHAGRAHRVRGGRDAGGVRARPLPRRSRALRRARLADAARMPRRPGRRARRGGRRLRACSAARGRSGAAGRRDHEPQPPAAAGRRGLRRAAARQADTACWASTARRSAPPTRGGAAGAAPGRRRLPPRRGVPGDAIRRGRRGHAEACASRPCCEVAARAARGPRRARAADGVRPVRGSSSDYLDAAAARGAVPDGSGGGRGARGPIAPRWRARARAGALPQRPAGRQFHRRRRRACGSSTGSTPEWATATSTSANLSVNTGFDDADDERLLEAYFGEPPTAPRFAALRLMRLMSDFREAMWGVVQTVVSSWTSTSPATPPSTSRALRARRDDPRYPEWLRTHVPPPRELPGAARCVIVGGGVGGAASPTTWRSSAGATWCCSSARSSRAARPSTPPASSGSCADRSR